MTFNRKVLLVLIVIFLLASAMLPFVSLPSFVEAAPPDAYWVGGSGNWSDATNHWATTSNGSPNAANLLSPSGTLRPPENIVITETSDTCFDITWDMVLNSTATVMVICRDTVRPCSDTNMSSFNRSCMILYNGSGTSITGECGWDLNNYVYTITAWGINSVGNFSTNCTQVTVGGDRMASLLLLAILFAVGGLLTFLAVKIKLLPMRLIATVAWIGLGVYLLLGNVGLMGLDKLWTQFLAFVPFVMAIVTILLQVRADTTHETVSKGRPGFPGAEKESWTEWGPKRKAPEKETAAERQAKHRTEVQSRIARGQKRPR